MNDAAAAVTLRHHFEPENNIRLSNLCGPLDAHLRRIEQALGVAISRRGAAFTVRGPQPAGQKVVDLLRALYGQAGEPLSAQVLELVLAEALARGDGAAGAAGQGAQPRPRPARRRAEAPVAGGEAAAGPPPTALPEGPSATTGAVAPEPEAEPVLHTRRSELRGRTPNQVRYLRQILAQDITFGIGPAGTGKTFLAVACAVDALERHGVQRLVLTRPAVEAGERLGFLPGDLAQKVDPYLRPLYDALYDLMGFERVGKAFEKGMIEIAPLAFMRGRTLNHAFVILDEAQNTTREQMKMFLTRLGFGSRCVVTGDVSQIDLPPGVPSGLVDARDVLAGVPGIGFTAFGSEDVVRHPLVARIVEAYDAARSAGGSLL